MSFSELICGISTEFGVANNTLDHLAVSITRFSDRAVKYLNEEFSEEAQNFGAFCTRVVLENSCAALVGRLDTFRLMYLAEFQGRGSFEHGRPSKSGFRWTGDVLPDDKPVQEMWGVEHDVSRVSRALFSQYADHMYWRPGLEALIDFTSNYNGDEIDEIKNIDPEKYSVIMKGKFSSLYSTLSKGVHWDFFVSSVVLDQDTIKESIRESLISLSTLGLISHFVPTAYRSLNQQVAVQTYQQFRKAFQ